MSTDIKLLPPPKWLLEGFTDPTIERLCDYTRANVARATAPLQAEIEALQVLLDEVRSLFTRDDDMPDDLLPRIDAALAAQQGDKK